MGLGLLNVLGPAHRHERRAGERVLDEWHGVGDREGVAVEEHQQVVVGGMAGDLPCQVVELARVHATLLDDAVEMHGIGGIDALQR